MACGSSSLPAVGTSPGAAPEPSSSRDTPVLFQRFPAALLAAAALAASASATPQSSPRVPIEPRAEPAAARAAHVETMASPDAASRGGLRAGPSPARVRANLENAVRRSSAGLRARLAMIDPTIPGNCETLEQGETIARALDDFGAMVPRMRDEDIEQLRRTMQPMSKIEEIRHGRVLPGSGSGSGQSNLIGPCPGYAGGYILGPIGGFVADMISFINDAITDADPAGAYADEVDPNSVQPGSTPPGQYAAGLAGEEEAAEVQAILEYITAFMPDMSIGIAFVIDFSLTFPSPIKIIFQTLAQSNSIELRNAQFANARASDCQTNQIALALDALQTGADDLASDVLAIANDLTYTRTVVLNAIDASETQIRQEVLNASKSVITNDNSNTQTILANSNANRVTIVNVVEQSRDVLFAAGVANKNEIIDVTLRVAIEEDLMRTGTPLVLFSMPAARGGHLDRVRAIVLDTIQDLSSVGYVLRGAEIYWGLANTEAAAGNYKQAYDYYRTAYRMAADS